MRNNLKAPCKECPFRRKALPGWLGPWDAEELSHAISYVPFPCHPTIGEDADGAMPGDPRLEKVEACAGMAIHLNNRCERSRDKDNLAMQQAIKPACEADPALAESVFKTRQEFIEHHTQDLREWSRKLRKGKA